jgi:hypothetical protein
VFQQQKDFISGVMSELTLADDKFKIAVASYGTNTNIDVGFDSYGNNKTLLLDKISNISFANGTTDIHKASYTVRDIINGSRGINQFVFLFTDGMPSNLQPAVNGTGELRARLLNSTSSNELLFISFGDDVRHEGYRRMSGDPHYEDVFTHTAMDSVYHVMKKLVDEKCTGMLYYSFLYDVSMPAINLFCALRKCKFYYVFISMWVFNVLFNIMKTFSSMFQSENGGYNVRVRYIFCAAAANILR